MPFHSQGLAGDCLDGLEARLGRCVLIQLARLNVTRRQVP